MHHTNQDFFEFRLNSQAISLRGVDKNTVFRFQPQTTRTSPFCTYAVTTSRVFPENTRSSEQKIGDYEHVSVPLCGKL